MKANDLLYRAVHNAIDWNTSLLDAYRNDRDSEFAKEIESFIEQLIAYRKKRWGTTTPA